MGGGGSAHAAQAEQVQKENDRLKKQLDEYQKKVQDITTAQKEATAKANELTQRNAELEAGSKKISDATNERAKSLAQQELVNMAKVWRAERAVEQCKGITEVAHARLEFWTDAHEAAQMKVIDMHKTSEEHKKMVTSTDVDQESAQRAEAAARERLAELQASAAEAHREVAECRTAEREALVDSFSKETELALVEVALERGAQEENSAQELVEQREVELKAAQEALDAAKAALVEARQTAEVKKKEKAEAEAAKEAKQAALLSAEEKRKEREEAAEMADSLVIEAQAALVEAQRVLEGTSAKQVTLVDKTQDLEKVAVEVEHVESAAKEEKESAEAWNAKAEKALDEATMLLERQDEERKYLEALKRGGAAIGDSKAALEAAAMAAARALLEIVPYSDPGSDMPAIPKPKPIFSESYYNSRAAKESTLQPPISTELPPLAEKREGTPLTADEGGDSGGAVSSGDPIPKADDAAAEEQKSAEGDRISTPAGSAAGEHSIIPGVPQAVS
eukprot:gb/GFBE01012499.1/.p1 GENE.gb/GFBE01012499.1/~~gb/GFBE01012499.1/.p1  ORF type:complete len:508 (+),score=167.06 gb/GFBE01012499.1/:1-1524(+)